MDPIYPGICRPYPYFRGGRQGMWDTMLCVVGVPIAQSFSGLVRELIYGWLAKRKRRRSRKGFSYRL